MRKRQFIKIKNCQIAYFEMGIPIKAPVIFWELMVLWIFFLQSIAKKFCWLRSIIEFLRRKLGQIWMHNECINLHFLLNTLLNICFSLWIHNLPVTPVLKFWPTFQTSNNEKNQQSLPTPYKVCCPLFNLILVCFAFDLKIYIIVIVIKSLLLHTQKPL